ncbi:MAG: fluoride efflux transporter CrcB [Acidobacteriota bacterium]|nr:fluoride efflux transporter CrcB [Acidobacteriota bacterium]
MIERYLLVTIGGGAGALARYVVTLQVNEKFDPARFPLATFLINILGSFLIGLLMVLLDREDLLHPNLRPLLVTGVLGGFTTFSSFEWEVFSLGRHTPPSALFYAIVSVVLGWLACWFGASISRMAAGR